MPEPPLPYARMAECRACPRLSRHLDEVAQRHPGYYCRPVLPWGRRDARLLIVGLAPGMHGANRTGQPFTGDASGFFLFEALTRAGFATTADPFTAVLINARITNAVRCLPPDNRPVMDEVRRCAGYLAHELHELWRPGVRKPRCVLALGRIAHEAVGIALDQRLPAFGHGRSVALAPRLTPRLTPGLTPRLIMLDTYHPSRQNTQTGRLTPRMLDGVLSRAADHLSGAAAS